MLLAPRSHARSDEISKFPIGTQVVALPPTMRRPVRGEVVDAEGFVRAVKTIAGLVIAVDVEDCHASAFRRQ
ncbi:MAG: hypothetical protein M3O28_03635 [Actinomycetota bacterium]|nr:hypothetical protein [Actinomycetota bacterium]